MSSNQSVQENPTAPRVPSQLNTSFFQRVDGIEDSSEESNGDEVGSESTCKKSKSKSGSKLKPSSNVKEKKESKILKQSDKHLVNIISREIKYKDLNERMLKSKQENVFIKEVLIESEIDYINSLKQLKGVFKTELQTAINKVNSLYQTELVKLQQLYRSAVVGESLIDIIKTISKKDWYLLMKDNSVNAYKFYNPPFEVTEGYFNSGIVHEYTSPVCSIRGIYVNILHHKITHGTIHLSTIGQHPNCNVGGFGQACPGSFEDRDICLADPNKLLTLLEEISSTYEKIHLDSSYYKPTIPFDVKHEYKWKAS